MVHPPLMLIITFSSLWVLSTAKHEKFPAFRLPLITFDDLMKMESSTVIEIVQSLTNVGALQIVGMPGIKSFQQSITSLTHCMINDENTVKSIQPDNSKKYSSYSSSQYDILHSMTVPCTEAILPLRNSIDSTTSLLLRALDIAASMQKQTEKVSKPTYLMSPYKAFRDVFNNGLHLEHFHMFVEPTGKSSHNPSPPATLDFHTDAGIMIAMTRGVYLDLETNQIYKEKDDSLFMELKTGLRVKVITEDDAIIFMLGEIASKHFNRVLGYPLHASTHALMIDYDRPDDEETPSTITNPTRSRSWYGKMYLPPNDAIMQIKNHNYTYGNFVELTRQALFHRQYDETAHRTFDHLGKGNEILFTACESNTMELSSYPTVNPQGNGEEGRRGLRYLSDDTCTADDGSAGIECWMRCMSTTGLNCGSDATAQCVNPDSPDQVYPSDLMCTTCKPECVPIATNATYQPSGYCYGAGVSMYMDGFTSIAFDRKDHDIACLNLLFQSWTLDNDWKVAIACIGVLIVSILSQYLTHLRLVLFKQRTTFHRQLLTAFYFGVQITLGYLLMLVAMTYSSELFAMVCIGLTAGYVLFNMDLHSAKNVDPCCSELLEDAIAVTTESSPNSDVKNVLRAHGKEYDRLPQMNNKYSN